MVASGYLVVQFDFECAMHSFMIGALTVLAANLVSFVSLNLSMAHSLLLPQKSVSFTISLVWTLMTNSLASSIIL
jgi:hypothetical protein